MREKFLRAQKKVKSRSPKVVAAALQQKDKQIEILSQLVSIMGVFQAIATVPQAVQLYSSQDATGLSLLSWLYYSLFAVVLVMYGIVQGQKPIIISYTTNAIAYSSIAAGIILFR